MFVQTIHLFIIIKELQMKFYIFKVCSMMLPSEYLISIHFVIVNVVRLPGAFDILSLFHLFEMEL